LADAARYEVLRSEQPVLHAQRLLRQLRNTQVNEETLSETAVLIWLPAHTDPAAIEMLADLSQDFPGLLMGIRPFATSAQASPAKLRVTLRQVHEQQVSVQMIKRRGPVTIAPCLVNLPLLLLRGNLGVLAKSRLANATIQGLAVRGLDATAKRAA
jgi:hypothetical protein